MSILWFGKQTFNGHNEDFCAEFVNTELIANYIANIVVSNVTYYVTGNMIWLLFDYF